MDVMLTERALTCDGWSTLKWLIGEITVVKVWISIFTADWLKNNLDTQPPLRPEKKRCRVFGAILNVLLCSKSISWKKCAGYYLGLSFETSKIFHGELLAVDNIWPPNHNSVGWEKWLEG